MTNDKTKLFWTYIIAISLVVSQIVASPVSADQYDDFVNSGQHNNVISDANFIDINSMSAQDIQNFFNSNNSYLKDFVDNSEAGKGRSAAQIVWDAAHGKYEASGSLNGITVDESTGTVSPKVILVYLQKEQSLVSRTTWNDWAMIASLGYFCYAGVTGDDNGNNCKDIYEGFTKQVENGAWQLRYNYIRAQGSGFSDYQVGEVRTTSDNYQVTLTNRATSSVYRYTPYVFYSAFNVWNLFHNVYFSGSVPQPNPETSTNDTGEYRLKTYNSIITLSGSKASATKAIFNETLLADIGATSWSISFEFGVGDNNNCIYYKDENGNVVTQKNIFIKRHKMADINGDGAVEISDLAIFAENWGKNSPSEVMSDFNADNIVDITDLAIFADSWGK